MDEPRYVDRLIELISDMSREEQKKLLDNLDNKETTKARKHSREECLIIVNYAIKGRAYQNFIQNIGAGGAFVETRAPLTVGDKILLTISYSKEQRPFKIEGEIARVNSEGVGIKFKTVSQVQEELINLIVEMIAK